MNSIQTQEQIIQPRQHFLSIDLKEIWRYRELLYFLIWRDIKIKYKQSLLGIGWAVFQPVMSMIVFTLVFGKMAKMPSDGIPYPAFTLCGVIIWNYFSESIRGGTDSLIRNTNLITKVYFPRIIIPIAAVGRGLFDFIIAFFILNLILIYYKIYPTINIIAFPIFLLLTFTISLAICFWTSAISVKYRDLPYTIPFLVQLLFWLSPVAYGGTAIPEKYAFLYSLNPMYGVIEGFRWSLTGTPFPSISIMGTSMGMVFLFFLAGLWNFKTTETHFADII